MASLVRSRTNSSSNIGSQREGNPSMSNQSRRSHEASRGSRKERKSGNMVEPLPFTEIEIHWPQSYDHERWSSPSPSPDGSLRSLDSTGAVGGSNSGGLSSESSASYDRNRSNIIHHHYVYMSPEVRLVYDSLNQTWSVGSSPLTGVLLSSFRSRKLQGQVI